MNNQSKGKSKRSSLDYIFVLRPMLFFPGWSTMLAGYLISFKSKVFHPLILPDQIDYLQVFILIISFAMMMGSTFVLNQIADKKSDKVNRKLFIISDGYITNKSATVEIVILSLVGLGIGLLINIQVFVFYLFFMLLTGYFYNFKPVQLKNRPWGSLSANALMGWVAFAIGWAANKLISNELIIDSLPYLFFNTALYLFTTLPDINGDESAKKNTLAVKYGIKSVILSAFFLFGIGLMIALMLNDYQSLTFYILSIPFFIMTITSFEVTNTIKATKFGILFFALSICLKFPVYFLLMVTIFFVTKIYFRYRFNLNYPNFTGQ